MKFRIRLAVSFYEVMILLLVCFLAAFVTHLIPLKKVFHVLDVIYYDPNIRLLFALIASFLLIVTHMMGRNIYGLYQRERNIAFDNPAGRVYVTLDALEDLIRRTLSHLEEVKDARIIVKVKKGGELDVQTRLTLSGDYNIPEMTSRIQKVIQKKIEHTIGAERAVRVEVDVIKILSQDKSRKKVSVEPKEQEPNVPFEGYRA